MADLKQIKGCEKVALAKDVADQLEAVDQKLGTNFIEDNKDGTYSLREADAADKENSDKYGQFKDSYKTIAGKDIGTCAAPTEETPAKKNTWSIGAEAAVGAHYSPSDTITDKPSTLLRHDYNLVATLGGEKHRFLAKIGLTARSLGGDISLDGTCKFNDGATDIDGNPLSGENVNNCNIGTASFNALGLSVGAGYQLNLEDWVFEAYAKYAHLWNEEGFSNYGSYDGHIPQDTTHELGLSGSAKYRIPTVIGDIGVGLMLDAGAAFNNVGPIPGIPDKTANMRNEINGYVGGLFVASLSWPATEKDTPKTETPAPEAPEACKEDKTAVDASNDWLAKNEEALRSLGKPADLKLRAAHGLIEDNPLAPQSGGASSYKTVLIATRPDGSEAILLTKDGKYVTTETLAQDIAKESQVKETNKSAEKIITLNEQLMQFATAHPTSDTPDETDSIRKVADSKEITAEQFQSFMTIEKKIRGQKVGEPIVGDIQQVRNTIEFAQSIRSLISETKKGDTSISKISVFVEGHASKTGPENKNVMYSDNRAATYAAVMKSHGVENVASKGFGSSQPDDSLGRPQATAQQRVVVKIIIEYSDGRPAETVTAKDFAVKTQSKIEERPDVDFNTKYIGMAMAKNVVDDTTRTELFVRADGNDGQLGNIHVAAQDRDVKWDRCAPGLTPTDKKPTKGSYDKSFNELIGLMDHVAKMPETLKVDGMTKENLDKYKDAKLIKKTLIRVKDNLTALKASATLEPVATFGTDADKSAYIGRLTGAIARVENMLKADSAEMKYINDVKIQERRVMTDKKIDEPKPGAAAPRKPRRNSPAKDAGGKKASDKDAEKKPEPKKPEDKKDTGKKDKYDF